jgi:hypothetical protein
MCLLQIMHKAKIMKRYPGVVILTVFIITSAQAQTDSCWTALLVKKGKQLEIRKNMANISDYGFYLYRNCIYDIGLVSGKRYTARLFDIKQDTLIFLSYLNEAVAKKNSQTLDTLALNHKAIDKIFLIADRSMGLYSKISLDNYNMVYKQDTMNCALPIEKRKVFQTDPREYEVYPFLTSQGLNWIYELEGTTYYFMSVAPLPQPREIDTVYRKKVAWFIPPFYTKVDEINGLAAGFMAAPSNVKDSLKINGLCVEVLPLGFFVFMFGSLITSDSILFSKQPEPILVKINGFNISLGGSVGDTEINGVYMGGVSTIVNTLRGVAITGVHSISHEMKGVCISGLRNQSNKARGIQIALINYAKDFKGIQIGLWNKNQKRSLPIFNWNFRDSN